MNLVWCNRPQEFGSDDLQCLLHDESVLKLVEKLLSFIQLMFVNYEEDSKSRKMGFTLSQHQTALLALHFPSCQVKGYDWRQCKLTMIIWSIKNPRWIQDNPECQEQNLNLVEYESLLYYKLLKPDEIFAA